MRRKSNEEALVTCPRCGAMTPSDMAECCVCGAKLPVQNGFDEEPASENNGGNSESRPGGEKIICPVCGFANTPDSFFCEKCLTPLEVKIDNGGNSRSGGKSNKGKSNNQGSNNKRAHEKKPDDGSKRNVSSEPVSIKPLIIGAAIFIVVILIIILVVFVISKKNRSSVANATPAPAYTEAPASSDSAGSYAPAATEIPAVTAEPAQEEPVAETVSVVMDEMMTNTAIFGYEINLLGRLMGDLNLSYTIDYVSFIDMFTMLSTGDADLAIASLELTADRSASYDASVPYYTKKAHGEEVKYVIYMPRGNKWTEPVNRSLEHLIETGWVDSEIESWGLKVDDQYLLPDSDKVYLTDADLADLTWEECCLARNEIFARHGRIFKTPEIREYFESKPWYNGTISPDAFSSTCFNDIEKSNIHLISAYEDKMWGRSYY